MARASSRDVKVRCFCVGLQPLRRNLADRSVGEGPVPNQSLVTLSSRLSQGVLHRAEEARDKAMVKGTGSNSVMTWTILQ